MKRTWLVWTLVGGVLVTVLIAFNYERGKEAVPLSEIFPGKGALHNEVEYEFFDTDEKGSALVATAETKQPSRPAQAAPTAAAKAPVTSVPAKPAPAGTSSTAKPKTTVVTPAGSSGGITTPTGGNGKIYTIQVAAFKERSRADKAVAQAQQKGYPAYVDEKSRSDGSIWYQICIGKFDTHSPAKELLIKIKQDYKDGFIRTLSGK
ncbi:MAG: SPOR domain-containing protein [Candidatus Omnitrophica bacterium]|nr:SPOR domain-containing protein [Candidatus Omnitrophota bacterium]